jgi:multiple antibiotic resistance protein
MDSKLILDFGNYMAISFLALFPILNPPAMAPVFLEMTSMVNDKTRHKLARKIGVNTFFLLLGVLVVGGWVLIILGISIPVIGIAGGLLLFHTAWSMLNNSPKISHDEQEELQSKMHDKAFFPLTMPVTAGPGSMAITLTLVPAGSLLEIKTLVHFAGIAAGIALAALTVFLFYRFSANVLRRLGKSGSATISRLSAFILLAIGVQIVWNGICELIKTM